MTALMASWPAITVRRSRKYFSTSPAAAFRRARREPTRHAPGDRAASHQCDDPALLVSPDVVVAASFGIDLLAGAADHHLGIPAELHLANVGVFRARRRHADRRGHPVGHPVSRATRLFDLVSRGDVGAQSRQPDDEPAKADRVPDRADGHEPDPARDRRHSDDGAGDDFLRFQFLRHRAAADRVLLQSDFHQLVARHFRLGPGAAQWLGGGEHRLDADVRGDAAGLRLLSGNGAAALAAICRLGVAADLRLRGNAGVADRPCISGRSHGRGAADQRRALYCIICDISCAFAQRPAARFTDPGRRIESLILYLRDLWLPSGVDILICSFLLIDALLRIRHYGAMQKRLEEYMPIGEFGGAPPLVAKGSPALTTPMYWMYEMAQASLNPARAMTDATKLLFQNPLNPWSRTEFGKSVAAGCELFERTTRRYGKPEWGLNDTEVNGVRTPIEIRVVWEKSFCRLLYFDRKLTRPLRSPQPRVLIVAPMSGHYATLLRGTVEAFLPTHEVYITDWSDARMVPLTEGRFDLDDYVDYIIEMLHTLGGNMHIIAVCQPSVPVVAAVSIMEAERDPFVPVSMTLMGGPIDTRRNPTAVNNLAAERGIDWFRSHVITKVPFPHPGVMRDVYPGFLQLNGFISMNLDRHMDAHKNLFKDLVKGDGDLVDKHRDFYDEYLAVMDLTVEGENDDISGLGQTEATHALCSAIPELRRVHYVQKGVGHYGVFNGSRFKSEIVPRISDFMVSAANAKPSLRAAAE